MKNKLFQSILVACFGILFIPCTVCASPSNPCIIQNETIIAPKSDVLEWKFKIDNNKIYKRLFNATTDEWVGDWIYVGEYQG